MNLALFLIGMFIETSASIIVLAPILAPVAMHFGIDPVHFGIVMVVNLALGMITPPFGVNLFAACTVARISLDQIVTRLIPFVLVVFGCLMIITYVPVISLGSARPGLREVTAATQSRFELPGLADQVVAEAVVRLAGQQLVAGAARRCRARPAAGCWSTGGCAGSRPGARSARIR